MKLKNADYLTCEDMSIVATNMNLNVTAFEKEMDEDMSDYSWQRHVHVSDISSFSPLMQRVISQVFYDNQGKTEFIILLN